MSPRTRHAAVGALVAIAFTLAATVTFAQRTTPADVAAKFSGAWKINFELSPRFAPRGGGGGRQGGTPNAPSFAVGVTGTRTAPPMAFQRGGGGGTPAPMSAADQAGMAVIRGLQQVSDTLAITATADAVTFKDARGERAYVVDNKAARVEVNGATINTKSRWDRNTLKQEFVFGETRVAHDWEINNEGTRINFKMLIMNMSNPGPGTEAKAVYDKQ